MSREGLICALFLVAMGCASSAERPEAPGTFTGATTTPDSTEGDSTEGDSDTDPCVNSLPADQVPQTEPEFGVSMPVREDALPTLLSETGLYNDIGSKEINPAVSAFTPRFQLWSDGADKSRWAYIPECEVVDTSDMNDWRFPVGTRFFKEFSVDGKRIETRLIERIGDGPRDFAYASYQWNDNETEAHRVDEDGLEDAGGTQHDIPSKSACLRCHGTYARGGGRPSRALGFSALQLSHEDSEVTLDTLVSDGRLSDPPTVTIDVPGDPVTVAALGTLHANCGNCHNDTTDGLPQVDLSLWLDVNLDSVEQSATWRTAVGQPNITFNDQHVSARIAPGLPDESAVLYRMKQRGNNAQMPPLASETPDADGIAAVQAWVESLP